MLMFVVVVLHVVYTEDQLDLHLNKKHGSYEAWKVAGQSQKFSRNFRKFHGRLTAYMSKLLDLTLLCVCDV